MSQFQLNHIVNYIRRNKLTSFVNLLGLTIGFTIFLILGLYIKYETSFDTSYSQADQTYRLLLNLKPPQGESWTGKGMPPPLRAAIQHQVPEVIKTGRLYQSSEEVFEYEDKIFEEENAFYADQEMIDILDIELTVQNKEQPLETASNIIMSEAAALRYFGNDEPLGRIIKMPWGELEVSGIFKDMPGNVHVRPEILISYESPWWIKLYNDENWNFFFLSYYVITRQGTNPEQVAGKITNIFETIDDPTNGDDKKTVELQAITEIHFGNKIANEANTSDLRVIKALKGLALFILLIVLINYINLASAQIMERSSQVSIRKVLGISKLRIVSGFLLEVLLFQLLSVALAFAITSLLLPSLNSLLNSKLAFSLFMFADWGLFIVLLVISLLIAVLYPVLIILSFNPISAMKGKFIPSAKSITIRKALISFQFFISFALIFGTLVFYKQSKLLINKEIGLNTLNTLVIKSGHADWNSFPRNKKVFKTELEQQPGVVAVTNSNAIPGKPSYTDYLKVNGKSNESHTNFAFFDTDYDFIKTMGVKMVAGRSLSDKYPTDKDAAVITRQGSLDLGFKSIDDALNQEIISDYDQRKMTVVGVCEDFKLSNLNSRSNPFVIRILENQNRFISIRYLPGKESDIVKFAKEKWQLAFDDLPFRYFFLDANYRQVYANEVFQTKLISLFSLLAVLLASLGLFGITFFIVLKREREFCIRKVNGALIKDVFALVTRGFLSLIAIASVLAIPLSWWLANIWLSNYPTRIHIGFQYFIAPFLLLAVITIITISYHTLRTAQVNPARLLRNE